MVGAGVELADVELAGLDDKPVIEALLEELLRELDDGDAVGLAMRLAAGSTATGWPIVCA